MILSELLTPMAEARMKTTRATPPSPDDPESFGRAAMEIGGHRTDQWRLAVLLMSFEGMMPPGEAAALCVAMGDYPTIGIATDVLIDIDDGDLAQKILAALGVVAEADKRCHEVNKGECEKFERLETKRTEQSPPPPQTEPRAEPDSWLVRYWRRRKANR